MRSFEHMEAVALMRWWHYVAMEHRVDPRLFFHIPNGGMRSKATAGKLKAEGVRAGVPDYLLAVPRGPYAGLFLELKAKEGRLSPAQKEMLEIFQIQGYKCSVVYGTTEAMDVLKSYLSLPPRLEVVNANALVQENGVSQSLKQVGVGGTS